jgi:hypothetical protein
MDGTELMISLCFGEKNDTQYVTGPLLIQARINNKVKLDKLCLVGCQCSQFSPHLPQTLLLVNPEVLSELAFSIVVLTTNLSVPL